MPKPDKASAKRRGQLEAVANAYFAALAKKDFSAVPYDDKVNLRTPLAPGGSATPIKGKAAVLEFFKGLFPVLGGTKVVDHFINKEMTAICTKAEVRIVKPAVTLRVADLFYVSPGGKITGQENHYDPRPAMG